MVAIHVVFQPGSSNLVARPQTHLYLLSDALRPSILAAGQNDRLDQSLNHLRLDSRIPISAVGTNGGVAIATNIIKDAIDWYTAHPIIPGSPGVGYPIDVHILT